MLTGKLRWLDGSNHQDFTLWKTFWGKSAARRPHDHPGYLQAMKTQNSFPSAVIFKYPGGGTIFYAFYLQPLSGFEFISFDEIPLFHIISPYGYGGPIYEGPAEYHEITSNEFDAAFNTELRTRGVVSEFVREDLFQDRLASRKSGEHIQKQFNVIVSLDQSEEDLWRHYKPRVRTNVHKASAFGLKVVFDPKGQFLDDFVAIYHSTMERKGASNGYFFSKECFQFLTRTLGAINGLTYVHAFYEGKIISTELVLLSSNTAYFFLGGTLASNYDKKPNYLLKHEIILWAKQQGLQYYVLGGGVQPGDGIYQYKTAFAPDGLSPFFVRQIQHDPEKCRLLAQQRQQYEVKRGFDWRPDPDFFPAYLSGWEQKDLSVASLKANSVI